MAKKRRGKSRNRVAKAKKVRPVTAHPPGRAAGSNVPPFGWATNDQTASQIAIQEAARRRRHIAAVSSGPIDPIGPSSADLSLSPTPPAVKMDVPKTPSAADLSLSPGHPDAIHAPTVTATNTLQPPPFSDKDTFYSPTVTTDDGATGRAAQHEEMLSRIAVLERLIAERQRPGIGHNRPPELIEGFSFGEEELREIKKAVAILKAQPVVPNAPDEAQAAGSTLKKIGERLAAYLDALLSEAAKSAGNEFGKRVVQLSYWLALAATLINLAQSVEAWLR